MWGRVRVPVGAPVREPGPVPVPVLVPVLDRALEQATVRVRVPGSAPQRQVACRPPGRPRWFRRRRRPRTRSTRARR